MPAVSEAQRRYLFSKFGAGWVKAHHFDNPGKLPLHVRRAATRQAYRKRVRQRGLE
jgi:hypothetical protein